MARLTFMEFANAPMANVKTNINKVALVKPIAVACANTSNPTFASTSFIDAGDTVIKLVAIGVSDFDTYTVEPSKFIQTGQNAEVNDFTVKGTLTVCGNTVLGDARTDTITLNGTVANMSGTFTSLTGGTITAATALNATTVNAANLSINGVAYTPFYASATTPAASYQNRIWIKTSTNDSVTPYMLYYNGSTWVSIGAVFG